MRLLAVLGLGCLISCGKVPLLPPDATIDAYEPQDASPPTHHHFVIDQLTFPTNNTQAGELGFDLNGDQMPENQVGMVMSALSAQLELDSQIAMNTAIDRGTAIMLGDLAAHDLSTDASATFTIYQGANPMPPACADSQDLTCRQHLTGSASFALRAGAPIDVPLSGSITNSVLAAGPGHLTVQLSIIESVPFTITLLGARVELTATPTTLSGKLGGAITIVDYDQKIVPAIRDGLQSLVIRDCVMLQSPPDCGCIAGSTGNTVLDMFDTMQSDCTISADEIRNNTLIQSLFTADVTIEGMSALSFGVGVHAVAADFAQP